MKAQVIGAGLAGLSAAVALVKAGVPVQISEAAAQAGGRCRSYFDPQLGAVIDNGNHLVMSGNTAVYDYLKTIGAQQRLAGPDEAVFDFVDLASQERWRLRPNAGPLPWWVLAPGRRVPGTKAGDYLALGGLIKPKDGLRVDQVTRTDGVLWRRLIEPFLVAALNTEAEDGSAQLAAAVVRETLARGGDAYRPRIADPTLASAFIDPALALITGHGGQVTLGRRLKAITVEGEEVTRLTFADGEAEIASDELVVLAVPPWVAHDLLPDLTVPDDFRAIVNGHFMIAPPADAPRMIGVIGGTVEWIFAFDDRISVTVSAADRLVDLDRQALAERLWADVAAVLRLPVALPPWQVVKEKRATFAATVEQDARRPAAKTRWRNLVLAGDWTQTGLPSTIEGALRSGATAAQLAAQFARV